MLCRKCSLNKDKADFYRDRCVCKGCFYKYYRRWIFNHKDRPSKYREKRKEKQQLYYREWYKKNGRKRSKFYMECVKKWEQNHPKEKYAQYKLQYAIKKGLIKRSSTCNQCGRGGRIHGHHPNYEMALEVKWLCASCHKIIHLKK